jgi:hypothetical protein
MHCAIIFDPPSMTARLYNDDDDGHLDSSLGEISLHSSFGIHFYIRFLEVDDCIDVDDNARVDKSETTPFIPRASFASMQSSSQEITIPFHWIELKVTTMMRPMTILATNARRFRNNARPTRTSIELHNSRPTRTPKPTYFIPVCLFRLVGIPQLDASMVTC